MGANGSKDPEKQTVISEGELKIQGKYISGLLEHLVDKEVTNMIKHERGLLNKYGEDKRTVEDLLFKDEVGSPSDSASNDRDHCQQDQGFQETGAFLPFLGKCLQTNQ
jgi:hypothetical protein